jgi:hypothetical protein
VVNVLERLMECAGKLQQGSFSSASIFNIICFSTMEPKDRKGKLSHLDVVLYRLLQRVELLKTSLR